MKPYPLQFVPEMKERVWGGRSLEKFGLPVQDGSIGEGWMIADHPNGTTKVANGELAGMVLGEIRSRFGESILGTKGASSKNGRFPLLLKLLDCEDDLSIQVHPGDDYERLPAGELGKTEMWYILDAKPGAKIIYGLKPGTDRESLAEAIQQNRILDCLQEVPVTAGDSFYIPAGTVHALGAGVLVAEVQQNSDTVYRLYDYDRPGLDGQPRELHIEDSLSVITYQGAGATRMTTEVTEANQWLTLAHSPYFIVEKGITDGPWELETTEETFVIHVVCDGKGEICWEDGTLPLQAGSCLLIPASLGSYQLKGSMTVLRSYLP
ncbi:type I phosphomannose isomerase catalytic subunit [Paenibacillus sp. J2TS4]|uniref:type I phosphomannose isomerase catalytic subunit n=1 Tax=Paenibacillus sp. J2TS4 TaxID=2807194 RepID=UPI001B2C6ACF|nr:type I phosphomannose isomerase catalytic subunit [Paenibacillus sp. J2TS4]GIP34452.1 mannose-6-phosphate isomerase, class I [Paenibacillus sp. J2TS4]